MRVCYDAGELEATIEQIRTVAATRFGNGIVSERFLPEAGHVEVQVFGDGLGGVMVLGDRLHCERNQKVVECPAQYSCGCEGVASSKFKRLAHR